MRWSQSSSTGFNLFYENLPANGPDYKFLISNHWVLSMNKVLKFPKWHRNLREIKLEGIVERNTEVLLLNSKKSEGNNL